MAKSKPKFPCIGRWRIVSMSAWEDEYLDEEDEAFIEFNDKGDGSFQAPKSYGVGSSPASVAVGDLNGDGKLDLAVAI